jgi:signal transduction histidine kinase
MLRNLKVGTKLVATLAAPAIVIVILVTVGVRDRLAVADSAGRVEQLAEFASVTADLAQQLQVEALWTVTKTASDGAAGQAELDAQRAETDASIARFREAVESTDPGNEGESVEEALRFVDARLGILNTTRIGADVGQSPPTQIAQNFGDGSDALVGLNSALVQTANDPELLRGLSTIAAIERVKLAQADLAAQVVAAARLGAFTDREGERCTGSVADCESYTAALQAAQDVDQAERAFSESSANPAEKQIAQNAQVAQGFDDLTRQVLTQTAAGNAITVSPEELTTQALTRIDSLASVDATFTESVMEKASDLKDAANRGVVLYLVGGLGALVVAFAIGLAVARSVTRPLQRLTTAAYRLSAEQLPSLVEQLRNPGEESEGPIERLEPIPVDSRDEIGQLAEAFNSIQTVTVDVAEEQSRLLRKGIGDIFVHLARRNQSLLDRQIEFIDHLETHEEDPDQLDNLFKLDHLATRMRRNAESLLVLAGAEPPRRRGRPVPVVDVVRVAIGEVEDFARVHLIALDDATIAGNVAVDLAHLLSELMENATHFSPPETSVEILGRRDDRNGYVITVADRGIGMNAHQLAEANSQLANPPLVGLALSRSLGFIVIGRLASRFGLTVRLEPTPNGGTTASVTLPYSVVEFPDDDTAQVTGRMGTRSATAARSGRTGRATSTERPSRPAPPVVERSVATPVGRAPEQGDLPVRPATPRPSAPAEATPGSLPTRRANPAPAATPTTVGATAGQGAGTLTTAAPPVSPAPTETTPSGGVTTSGLARRTPKTKAAPADVQVDPAGNGARPVAKSTRSPDEVRRMLSRYRSGLDRGRASDVTADPGPAEPA